MTTLVALATKDAIVLGCDSLGTVPKYFIDPVDLLPFFDKKSKLRKDKEGNPVISELKDVFQFNQEIPFSHMTYVDKMFSLKPLSMGAMATGITSIGKRTIKSLMRDFSKSLPEKNIIVSEVAQRLLDFTKPKYEEEFKEAFRKPYLEIMLCGYDKNEANSDPHIMRVDFPEYKVTETFKGEDKFGVAFGGQMKEIQRIVHGTDISNKIRIENRHQDLMNIYRDKLQEFLSEHNCDIKLPGKEDTKEQDEWGWNIFSKWSLEGFDANWGDFSDQNAIECVNFFIEIMINSQQFSNTTPTVGGEIHIAIITKESGFKSISREEYVHEGHTVSKD